MLDRVNSINSPEFYSQMVDYSTLTSEANLQENLLTQDDSTFDNLYDDTGYLEELGSAMIKISQDNNQIVIKMERATFHLHLWKQVI